MEVGGLFLFELLLVAIQFASGIIRGHLLFNFSFGLQRSQRPLAARPEGRVSEAVPSAVPCLIDVAEVGLPLS